MQQKQKYDPHGCVKCGEVDKDYIVLGNGRKKCEECGGVVMTLQEGFDYILSLKAALESGEKDYLSD